METMAHGQFSVNARCLVVMELELEQEIVQIRNQNMAVESAQV